MLMVGLIFSYTFYQDTRILCMESVVSVSLSHKVQEVSVVMNFVEANYFMIQVIYVTLKFCNKRVIRI